MSTIEKFVFSVWLASLNDAAAHALTACGKMIRVILQGAMAPVSAYPDVEEAIKAAMVTYGLSGAGYVSNFRRVSHASYDTVRIVIDACEENGYPGSFTTLFAMYPDAFPRISKRGRPAGQGAGKTPTKRADPENMRDVRVILKTLHHIQGIGASMQYVPHAGAALAPAPAGLIVEFQTHFDAAVAIIKRLVDSAKTPKPATL